MNNLQERYRQFKEWEQQPHQVAPRSEEEHVCATCGTHFEGNYCPRCGQSAKIGRYSFKKALLLFLDVWGLGNRGMFRSIRDLLLRPGYMIRDYIRGMQMAYFPPFKMFFLLLTLGFLIDTGINIQGINRQKLNNEKVEAYFENMPKEENLESISKKEEAEYERMVTKITMWHEKNVSLVTLASLLLFSVPLWLMFRRSPAIPDMRLSECFVAMVYITNMLLLYSMLPSLLCFSLETEMVFDFAILLLAIVPIKQLSGYSYWGTIWRILVALVPFFIFISLMMLAGIVALWIYIFIKY